MTEGPMERRLIDYIAAELNGDPSHRIAPDDELLLDGIIDSIGAMRLVDFIEQTWNLRVPPQDITVENFGSVTQIAGYLRDRAATAH